MPDKKSTIRVLVLCTGNSCRSQMAEGWLRHLDTGHRLEVYSAGIETHGLNPRAVKVMAEAGVDISSHTSNHLDDYRDIDFDYVITVCDHAREHCPYFPGNAKRIHKNFSDPAQAAGSDREKMESFRDVRDRIKRFSETFLKELHVE